jgi:hypothetical protein
MNKIKLLPVWGLYNSAAIQLSLRKGAARGEQQIEVVNRTKGIFIFLTVICCSCSASLQCGATQSAYATIL